MEAKCNGAHFEDDEDVADDPSDEDGSLFTVDWSTLFELAVLCPMPFPSAGDGDLERVYARCEQGCCIEGRVFF